MCSQDTVSDALKCPGCHFQCKLVKYQCGRGKGFYDLVADGGELPERRGPMAAPGDRSAGPAKMPPLNDRVVFGFGILSHAMQKRCFETGEQKLVFALMRQGLFMTPPILAKRVMLSAEELDEEVEAAKRRGLVDVEVDERIGRVVCLTEAGQEQAAIWKAERDEQTAEFLSPLSDEEKETMDMLVRKLLGMTR